MRFYDGIYFITSIEYSLISSAPCVFKPQNDTEFIVSFTSENTSRCALPLTFIMREPPFPFTVTVKSDTSEGGTKTVCVPHALWQSVG